MKKMEVLLSFLQCLHPYPPVVSLSGIYKLYNCYHILQQCINMRLTPDIHSNSDSSNPLSGTSPSVPLTHHSHHPSPPHSFIPGLKPYFSANPSHRSLHLFFKTNSMDSLDCLPILLSISVFLLFLFSTFWFLVLCGKLSWLMSAFERTLKSILYRSVKAEISNFVQQTKLTAIYASLSKIIDAHIHEQFLIAD